MPSMHRIATLFAALLFCVALPAFAANYPDPKEGSWVARDFRFHTGEVMPEVTLHYRTIGSPGNEAVLILHGTAGNGGDIALYNDGPDADKAEAVLAKRLAAPFRSDANDVLLQW